MSLPTTIAANTLVLPTASSGTASTNISADSLNTNVQSVVGSGHVSVVLQHGVATLIGGVERRIDAIAAGSAAARFYGVDKVINRIFVSN